MNPIDFGGQRSRAHCGVRGDDMLCIVWFKVDPQLLSSFLYLNCPKTYINEKPRLGFI